MSRDPSKSRPLSDNVKRTMTNRLGFLSKHPTTQKPIPSPFINIGINYMNQAVRLWNEIFQIVKENCSTDYDETPQNDLMERLLRAREGK